MICKTCDKEIEVPCPCGTCEIKTKFSACPKCEPERYAKVSKMQGLNVCAEYVTKQLGI